MDILLLNRKNIDIQDLQDGFRAIDNNDFSIPYLPNVMYHSNPQDAWDFWENEQYLLKMNECSMYWNKIQGLSRRIRKLEAKRRNNSSYCLKSTANLVRHVQKKNIIQNNTPNFRYLRGSPPATDFFRNVRK